VAVVVMLVAIALAGAPAAADPPSFLDRANGHPHLDNGKAVAHASGGSEVSFDEARAEGADAQGSLGTAELPPDATASSLGCANRGTVSNPRVNRDCTLRRQAEEFVVVNPIDANNVVAGTNDSRVGYNHCGFEYSLDAGVTWGDGQPPFFQHASPIGHTYDAASDPALAIDGNGRAWYSCVLFDVNSNASGLFVVPSTAALKGSAYTNIPAGASPYVVAETASGKHFYDKEFIAADRRAGHTEVYVTFTDFQADPSCKKNFNKGGFCQSPIMLSKWIESTDPEKAGHWTAPIEISGHSSLCTLGNSFNPRIASDSCNFNQGSFPVVMANGDVYVVWNNYNTPTLVNQQLGVKVSADLSTVGAPVKVGQDDQSKWALCDLGRGPEGCVDSLNVRTGDFPYVATDPTSASHLVAVWQDTRGTTTTGNYRIVVSESTDAGATWSDASGGGAVLSAPGTDAYFQPAVAVASNGTIVVSAYHANTAQHTTVKGDGTFGYGYFVKSGGSFGPYQAASNAQNYPSPQTNPAQRGFLGDYSSIAAAPSGAVVYMVWSDTRNTFEFIESGKPPTEVPDEDVFVFKVTVP